MKIRTKFILIFFTVSLVPIVVSNGIFFSFAKESVSNEVIKHLESVASIQRTKMLSIYEQNMERLGLVASRTQLRVNLDKFNRDKKSIYQDNINRIILDSKESIDDFSAIHIYALDGMLISSTGVDETDAGYAKDEAFKAGLKENQAKIFAYDGDQKLQVYISGPLYLEDKLLGVLVIESSTENMLSSVSDYTGLGESGETVLAVRNDQGEAIFLMPARFNKNAALSLTISKDQKNIPINYAINGVEKIFTDFVDYRNVPVLSVTRYIENANWGLVVKIDKSEAFSHLSKMRNILIIILVVALLLVIAISLFMSHQITQPIIQLLNAIKRVTEGEADQRVNIDSKDEIGELAGAFNHMIEARQTYVRELEEKTTELKLATKLKSEFLANMSHELRTPMNSIIGFTGRVLKKSEDKLDDRQKKNLRTVVRNAHHLLNLINGLLDVSKIEAGKMEVHAESFDLVPLVEEVISLTQSMIGEKPIELKLDIPSDMVRIHTDNIKLKQILINLVSNAIKFTREGNVTVAARLLDEASKEEGARIIISVTDTGAGMDAEALSFIFDAFRQVDGSTTRKAGGAGLGLTIVQKFTELLKGTISVKSEQGSGTSFELIFPVDLGDQETETSVDPLSLDQLKALNTSKKTILCIDDEAEVRELISDYLVDEGYQVVTARSAEEGLVIAKQIQPFAITLDILMPHKDGWTVLNELKSNVVTRNIPVFVISFMDNKALGYQLGAFDYIQKPLNPERLINGIKQLSQGDINSALVVDDDPEARELMLQILEDADITCEIAVDGNDALEVLGNSKGRLPEIILLDLMMPGMDGFELLQTIQQNPVWAKIPVIVVTAKTLEEHEDKFLRPRVAGIQAKEGLTSEQVLDKLGTVMNHIEKNQKG